jgi:hypothetical protein
MPAGRLPRVDLPTLATSSDQRHTVSLTALNRKLWFDLTAEMLERKRFHGGVCQLDSTSLSKSDREVQKGSFSLGRIRPLGSKEGGKEADSDDIVALNIRSVIRDQRQIRICLLRAELMM